MCVCVCVLSLSHVSRAPRLVLLLVMILVVFVFAQNSGEFERSYGKRIFLAKHKREEKTMYPKVLHLFVITTRNNSRSHSL